jgi:5'-nucleotidase/UDP-sugar diphosphatase
MKRWGWLIVAVVLMVAAVLILYLSSPGVSSETKPTVAEVDTGVMEGKRTPAAVATQTGPVASQDLTEKVVILHTNDFHGAVEPQVSAGGAHETGGLVNLVSLIDQLRGEDPEHTLLLDAGDSFQGSYVSNSSQGQVVMAAMNVAGYDAWTLGNHEFDWGQEVLRERIDQAEFPVLAANLLDIATGQVWEPVAPYTIVEVGRARVAILGLTYPDTPVINKPQNVEGLGFEGAVETVRRYLPELEEQADLIVVLSHAGYDYDLALAKAVDGVDVIVGGHSHKSIERPYQVKDTIIVQAGAKGQVIGRLELTVDLATGQVTDYVRRNVLQRVTDEVPVVNSEVQALVEAALAEAAETINQPIGETARALEPQSVGEFALGNLVVDAMRATDLDGQPADMAFHNNGGIRAGLARGPINYGQIYAVLPFDNQLMAMDLTGEQILRILEHSVASSAGKMQVAGLSFRFSMSKPAGRRVQEVTVGGEPLTSERVYRVVTIDYLASGGDGYETFLEGADLTYGDSEVWIVAEYVRTHSPVDPQVEGRISQQ